MKILITGAAGQLGTELCRQMEMGKSVLGPLDSSLQEATVISVDLEDGDLTVLEQTLSLLRWYKPDVVINCAAYTNVDGAETERDAAFAANALIPRNLAIGCQQAGIKLVHISTDYVFASGEEKLYTEADSVCPKGAYGNTKYLGEEFVRQFCSQWYIVRTAWLYGRTGKNFVKTIMQLAEERDELRVVNDQFGTPTNAEDLAHHILKLISTEEYGLYHCTGQGICSWYDFAKEIVALSGGKAQVLPCSTQEFPRPAPRPSYSPLDNTMLRLTVGDQMRTWQDALKSYMEELNG